MQAVKEEVRTGSQIFRNEECCYRTFMKFARVGMWLLRPHKLYIPDNFSVLFMVVLNAKHKTMWCCHQILIPCN